MRDTRTKWKIDEHALSQELEWFTKLAPKLKLEGFENMEDLSCKSTSQFKEDIIPILKKICKKRKNTINSSC